MKTLRLIRALAPVDIQNIRRDPLLLWIPVIPLLMAVAIRIIVPQGANLLQARTGFDLTEHYPLIMGCFVLLTPSMIGMVIGFLLLDERDDRVLTALLVTPMPVETYLLYRLCVPGILGFLMTLVGYPVAGLTPVALIDLVAVALLGSITASLMALFLAGFAANKVAGFALLKLLNAVLLLPIAAFFVESRWTLLAGIVPPYWPLKVFILTTKGQPYAVYLVVGLAINLLALALLLRRFKIVIHR